MDSTSAWYYSHSTFRVSCFRYPSHYSQRIGSSSRVGTKPTVNQNSLQHFFKLSRYAITCREIGGTYGTSNASLPPSQSLKHFLIFRTEGRRALIKVRAMKGPEGFGPLPEKKNSTQNEGTPNGKEFDVVLNNTVQSDDDDEIPEIVLDRIISRILFYVGVPMGLGFVLLYFLNFLKMELKWDVPLWLTGLTTLITFGSSALGLTYGIVSASWDPSKEGSVLGLSEAKRNWPMVWNSGQGKEEE